MAQETTTVLNETQSELASDLIEECRRFLAQQGVQPEKLDRIPAQGTKGEIVTGLVVAVAAPVILKALRAAAKMIFRRKSPTPDEIIKINGKTYKLTELEDL